MQEVLQEVLVGLQMVLRVEEMVATQVGVAVELMTVELVVVEMEERDR